MRASVKCGVEHEKFECSALKDRTVTQLSVTLVYFPADSQSGDRGDDIRELGAPYL